MKQSLCSTINSCRETTIGRTGAVAKILLAWPRSADLSVRLIGSSPEVFSPTRLVLEVSSGERGEKSRSSYIGGSICERSVLGVVARLDPFLSWLVDEWVER